MRCVASAISCRRRSTSCCQRSAISDELHKLLCGICPLSSFDICFPFSSCQFSAIGLCGVKCPFSVKSEEGKHTGCISSLSGKIAMDAFPDKETHFLLSSTSFSFLLSYAHPIGLPLVSIRK